MLNLTEDICKSELHDNPNKYFKYATEIVTNFQRTFRDTFKTWTFAFL